MPKILEENILLNTRLSKFQTESKKPTEQIKLYRSVSVYRSDRFLIFKCEISPSSVGLRF